MGFTLFKYKHNNKKKNSSHRSRTTKKKWEKLGMKAKTLSGPPL